MKPREFVWKNKVGLIGLLVAETISMAGSRIAAFAVSWLVLIKTGDAVLMGLVGTAAALPYVLAAAFGAPLIDRVGARRLTIISDLTNAVLITGIALTYTLGILPMMSLIVLAGITNGLADHARRVVLSAQIKVSGVETARITSIYDGISRIITLVGAPIGGLVIALMGSPTAILINAASFGICGLLMLTIVRNPPGHVDKVAADKKEPYFVALRGGVAYVWRDRLLTGMVLMLFVTNLCNQIHNILIPLWIKQTFDSAAGLGTITAAFALGAVLGNIGMAALVSRIPKYMTLVLGYMIGGSPRFFIFALTDDLTTLIVVIFVTGFAMSSINPIIGALLLDKAPADMQARLFGVFTAVAWGGIPLGSLVGGWIADEYGLHFTAVATGALYFLATLTPVIGRRTWRQLDDKRPAADEDQPGGADDTPGTPAGMSPGSEPETDAEPSPARA
ncbi:MFS transporter [Longispora sp. K20-0274]|uniref:MFS transporter n=1 Tax=Longispora sp. K20-0274 TaxID=3088255 RepID=UPI00399C1D4D